MSAFNPSIVVTINSTPLEGWITLARRRQGAEEYVLGRPNRALRRHGHKLTLDLIVTAAWDAAGIPGYERNPLVILALADALSQSV